MISVKNNRLFIGEVAASDLAKKVLIFEINQ